MYKHKRLNKEQFTILYTAYKAENNYLLFDYDIDVDWRYYCRDRSWFAAHIDAILELPENQQPNWIKKYVDFLI